jgi:hypothetical protein
MGSCPRLVHILYLLCCLLTVTASGDDFNFARLVFSPASLSSETLPLDDPNTDFVTLSHARGARRTTGHARTGGDLVHFPVQAVSVRPLLFTHRFARAADRLSAHTALNLPLLC